MFERDFKWIDEPRFILDVNNRSQRGIHRFEGEIRHFIKVYRSRYTAKTAHVCEIPFNYLQ